MGNGEHIKPEDWGWYKHDGNYLPVLRDKEAAPHYLKWCDAIARQVVAPDIVRAGRMD
jgi:hypothetical protein